MPPWRYYVGGHMATTHALTPLQNTIWAQLDGRSTVKLISFPDFACFTCRVSYDPIACVIDACFRLVRPSS